ncbi:MAG: hypothetical protein NTY99_00590, partial [DPANN group archaeon]|nr:hypothetical protein [DPANN group archaeon]
MNISGVTGYAPWNSTFGTSGAEHGYSVQQTSDGGYIITGQSNVSTYYSSILLLKTNSTGGQVWNKTFGYYGDVSDYNIGYSVQQTSDGGYIIAGVSGTQAILIKTNSTGDQLWNKTFGSLDAKFYSVKQLGDGGYIAVGYNYTNNRDVLLAKINSSGSTVWYNSYDYGGTEYGRSVVQTNDSGFAIAGYTTNGMSGSTDALILKTNSTGYTLWEKILGGTGTDEGLGILEEQDASHHLDMTGFVTGANRNCSLIRVTADSLSYTNYSFGGTSNDECNSITAGPSGDVMLTGYTKSSGAGGADVWLLRVNATSGVVAWNKTFGGTSDDIGNSTITASDGGYAIAGDTASFGAGSYDVWLIKAYEPGTPTISSWINLNVSYSDLDIVGVRDSSLFIARNNGTWETNTSKFANNYGVDTAAKVVYANITIFGSIFAPLGESTIVNNCANLTVAGTAYALGTNLSGLQASACTGASTCCIDIKADNVTLNCNGHNLSSPNGANGIQAKGRNNTIIENCVVDGYGNSIDLENTNYSIVENSQINNSVNNGIFSTGGFYNQIISNHIYSFSSSIQSSSSNEYVYNN